MTRDLSGFQVQPAGRSVGVAPPPPPPPPPEPTQTHAVEPARPPKAAKLIRRSTGPVASPATAASPARSPRRKVMTALAADLHRRLREEAEKRGVYKTDVVLEALARNGQKLQERQKADHPSGVPLRQRRRKAVADATQCQLYLTDDEREVLDGLGTDLRLSRSELVSRLLEMEFERGNMPSDRASVTDQPLLAKE